MKPLDMREGYRRFVASSLSKVDPGAASGTPFKLHSTEWIRILLVQGADETYLTIEVELSLPERTDPEQAQLVQMISVMIAHLEYMLRLHKVGFVIDLVGEDCLWTASFDAQEEPDYTIFESLIPPTFEKC